MLQNILGIAGYVVMGLGIVFMIFGIIGIFQPSKNFYYRILVSCKIDTVGILTFTIGLALRHGFSFFSGKLALIAIIILVLNPLVAHTMARSAYKGGYIPENEAETMSFREGSVAGSSPADKL